MKAAAGLGIIPPTDESDGARRSVIETMQAFCVDRKMRVPVLDVYFLIAGGQTSVRHLVRPSFYS